MIFYVIKGKPIRVLIINYKVQEEGDFCLPMVKLEHGD